MDGVGQKGRPAVHDDVPHVGEDQNLMAVAGELRRGERAVADILVREMKLPRESPGVHKAGLRLSRRHDRQQDEQKGPHAKHGTAFVIPVNELAVSGPRGPWRYCTR